MSLRGSCTWSVQYRVYFTCLCVLAVSALRLCSLSVQPVSDKIRAKTSHANDVHILSSHYNPLHEGWLICSRTWCCHSTSCTSAPPYSNLSTLSVEAGNYYGQIAPWSISNSQLLAIQCGKLFLWGHNRHNVNIMTNCPMQSHAVRTEDLV